MDIDGTGGGGNLVILGGRLGGRHAADIRATGGTITQITAAGGIRPTSGELVVEARGGAVLPGLRDHHLHLRALSAAGRSVPVGPPAVGDPAGLTDALQKAAAAVGTHAWIRGIGYHESVAGLLDRDRLDGIVADHPVRIQHRSGQLWILNSAALHRIGVDRPDGRFLHADEWLRDRIATTADPGARPGARPAADLAAVSRRLATFGVTGVSDATVTNGPDDADLLQTSLAQQVLVMGDERLTEGPRKLLLHDDDLPALDDLSAVIRASHRQGRVTAVHCVSGPSLWLALAAFDDAGSIGGDRIEHGSVIPPEAVAVLLRLGLTVVTQPNFVAERGDAYLDEVDPGDQPWLYRIGGLLDAGVVVAAGTDAPFGDPDPWRAMVAAVERRTASGNTLGRSERVSPEAALALFSGDLDRPGRPRPIAVGARADLCILALPWPDARRQLGSDLVVATIGCGRLLHARPGR